MAGLFSSFRARLTVPSSVGALLCRLIYSSMPRLQSSLYYCPFFHNSPQTSKIQHTFLNWSFNWDNCRFTCSCKKQYRDPLFVLQFLSSGNISQNYSIMLNQNTDINIFLDRTQIFPALLLLISVYRCMCFSFYSFFRMFVYLAPQSRHWILSSLQGSLVLLFYTWRIPWTEKAGSLQSTGQQESPRTWLSHGHTETGTAFALLLPSLFEKKGLVEIKTERLSGVLLLLLSVSSCQPHVVNYCLNNLSPQMNTDSSLVLGISHVFWKRKKVCVVVQDC